MRPLLYIAIIVSVAIPASLSANGRDSDGSRLQARPFDIKAGVQKDRLSPPSDSVDWRYFKLKESRKLKISVASSAPVNIAVSGATGKSVASARSKKGKATIERRFDAGLYYFSVTSDKATTYSIRAN